MIVSFSRRRTAAALLLVGVCSACSNPSTPNEKTTAPETAAAAPAVSDHGSVVGKAPIGPVGIPSIVVLEPRTSVEFPSQTYRPVMDQISLTFTPAVLLVRTGQPAEFRNSDDVLHNVRVREEATKEGTFNVAIPTGGTYTHTFPRDGFYDVGCDIHPGMSAQVVATSTPHATLADAEGNFTIYDIAPGSYTLTVYTGAERIERVVDVTGGKTEVNVTQ